MYCLRPIFVSHASEMHFDKPTVGIIPFKLLKRVRQEDQDQDRDQELSSKPKGAMPARNYVFTCLVHKIGFYTCGQIEPHSVNGINGTCDTLLKV